LGGRLPAFTNSDATLGTKGSQLEFASAGHCEISAKRSGGQIMNMGTVKWFNTQKGYGYIHPDDGGPNIFVHIAAVESAGMSDLKEGERVIFEIQGDERTGKASAVSLKPLVFATTPHLNGSFATANPFDIISAFLSSAMSPLLRP
jgi:cold shock protein